MKIIVNGKEYETKEAITLQALLEELNIVDKVMAAAVNMQIIKKEQWQNYILNENDKLEFLDFVGGG